MPRLEDLSTIQQQSVRSFPFMEHDTAPCSILSKPLSRTRLALVTSAGIHLRGDRRFTPGDQTAREIPSHTPAGEIVQSHSSIGFDRVPMYRDVNVCFPIDRVRELAERGTIGTLAPRFFSFMGAQRDPRPMVRETGPAVARQLRDDGVDVVLLTPT